MSGKLTLSVVGAEFTKKDIKERFDKYNKMYFEGKLGKCKILWLTPNTKDYGVQIPQPTKNGIESKILKARNTYWTEENLREVLVHEMIHMYVATVDKIKHDGFRIHGKAFKSHCKEIKERYGLDVPVKILTGRYGYKKKGLRASLLDKVLYFLLDG